MANIDGTLYSDNDIFGVADVVELDNFFSAALSQNLIGILYLDSDSFFTATVTKSIQDVIGTLYSDLDGIFTSHTNRVNDHRSDITITSLTATASIRGNKLTVTINDPRSGAIPSIAIKTVIFFASTINDMSTATEVCRGYPEARHDGLIEEQTYYYWCRVVNNIDSLGDIYPVSPASGVACTAIGISGLPFGLANGELVVDTISTDDTVDAGAVRFSIKTVAGADPDPDDPVYIAFRNPSSGRYRIRSITSALMVTLSSGSTLGVTADTAFHVWVVILDDDGDLALGVINCVTDFFGARISVVYLDENMLVGSSTNPLVADASGLIFAEVDTASVSFRIIGFASWQTGLATPGTWAQPDVVQLYVSGSPKPGDRIGSIGTETSSLITTTNVIPFDNTVPAVTEGHAVFLFGISTQAGMLGNIFIHDVSVVVSPDSDTTVTLSLHDTVSNTIVAATSASLAANKIGRIDLQYAGIVTGGAVTHNARVGQDAAGTLTINGAAGASKLGGGLLMSSYKMTEYMG